MIAENRLTGQTGGELAFAAPKAPPWQVAVWLFLLLNCVFALTSSGRVRTMDEVLPIYQVESLLARGNTAIPQATQTHLFYGKVDRHGQPRAPYPPGQAVAALPWNQLGHALARLPGVPPEAQDLVRDFATTLSSATLAALAATIFFLISCGLGVGEEPALAATGIVALGTPLFAYSAYFFSEPLTTVLLLGAAWALFVHRGEESASAWRAIVGGVLLGLLMWVRPTHVIAAPIFIFAVMASERKRCYQRAILVACVVAVFGLAYLVRNDALYGDAFDFGYPPAAEGGKRLNSFETPLWVGLTGFLLSPGKSVFLFAPPGVLALAGMRRLWQRNRDLAFVCAWVPVAYLFFYAKYTQWEGGYSFGPRYLVPVIVLLCLALGPMMEDASPRVKKIALALFIAGVLVQGVGMATSFLEDQANGTYYDAQWNYRMTHSPLVSQTKLLVKYLTSLQPAPIGLGFDRWFFYLQKGGVSVWLLATCGAVLLAGAVFFGRKLRRAAQP